ncbi:hypothetical protein [Bacillus cereus]|uniref:Uncharacterized protein n=1 Tax=Bacillus cereus TaxID=1396 RepID=A0A9X7M212_BACCE|nr:hypothetical protein [Bacillus cereus]QDZ76966.1 hypothetical protein D0437_29685 [Bacillus cereus]
MPNVLIVSQIFELNRNYIIFIIEIKAVQLFVLGASRIIVLPPGGFIKLKVSSADKLRITEPVKLTSMDATKDGLVPIPPVISPVTGAAP